LTQQNYLYTASCWRGNSLQVTVTFWLSCYRYRCFSKLCPCKHF